jgi:transposase
MAMVGFQGTPARLFYDFCLDDHVPFDHLLRGIDGHVEGMSTSRVSVRL